MISMMTRSRNFGRNYRMSEIIRRTLEGSLARQSPTSDFYESIFNQFRCFTMAKAEEEDVMKFYFYSRYNQSNRTTDYILTEAVIDRSEMTLVILCKYNRVDLFEFWASHFLSYLRQEGVIV